MTQAALFPPARRVLVVSCPVCCQHDWLAEFETKDLSDIFRAVS